MKRALAFAVAVTLVAGCSSAGSGVNLLPGSFGSNPANASRAGGDFINAARHPVGVRVTMRIPKHHRRDHLQVHPATISPSTKSVGISVNNGVAAVFNATPTSPNCSVGASGTTCTFTVKAPPGSDTFAVTTYSGLSGAGSALDRGTAIVPIAAGKANAPHIHLGPVVSTTADSGPGSLRYAVGSANPGDTIMFLIPKGSTIKVASTLTLNTSVSIAGPGVTATARTRDARHSNLTFSGITISGQGTHQIFVIGDGVQVTISGLILTGGSATTGGQPGGAIYNGGLLTLNADTLTANDSQVSSSYIVRFHSHRPHRGERHSWNHLHPHVVTYHYGGAVYNHASLVVSGSTFYANVMANAYNSQYSRGGAIYNDNYGTLVSTGNHYTSNAAYEGGAVYNNSTYGQASFTNDVFSGNYGCGPSNGCAATTCTGTGCTTHPIGYGGAVYDNAGPGITVTSSTFSGNFVGGAVAASTGEGGALNLEAGSPSITSSTFTNNLAGGGTSSCSSGDGGAIYEDAGNAIVLNGNVFTGNKAAGDDSSYGGAVYNDSNPDSGTGNKFTSNQALAMGGPCTATGEASGGALYAYYGITMSASTFSNNTAKANYDAWAGAIEVEAGSATLSGNAFSGNSAVATGLNTATSGYAYGGALYVVDTLRLNNNTFTSNSATVPGSVGLEAWGGAVYSNSTFTSNGNTFSSNSATVLAGTGSVDAKGGALYGDSSATLTSANDKFASNTASAKATVEGGAVFIDDTSSISNGTFTSNKVTATAGQSNGGALALNSSITLSNSTFTGNSSSSTGAGSASAPGGGAIWDAGGSTLNGVKVTGNTVTGGSGGGIYVDSSGEQLNNSTVSGNTATSTGTYAGGGGIYNYDGMAIANSTISGNTAAINGDYSGGGGLYIDDSQTIAGSTISGNKVTGSGTLAGGGGIYEYNYSLGATNTTISNNSAPNGGGLFLYSMTSNAATLQNVTFYQNAATIDGGNIYNDASSVTATMANSIAGGGSAVTGKDLFVDSGGLVTSMGYNILQTAKGGSGTYTAGTGDKTANPLLLGLSNNGGSTFTNAESSTSPGKAYIPWTSASNGTCGTVTGMAVDQRSFTRGAGGKCDVGAYEYNGSPSAIRVRPHRLQPDPRKRVPKRHPSQRPVHEREKAR